MSSVLDNVRYLARRTVMRTADLIVTAPVLRWTWSGLADETYAVNRLVDFRPSDREAVRDMMAGRYVLASKLVDTHGISPFAIESGHVDWIKNLHGFSWLRHFRDVFDAGQRGFARTLVLDWIGHEGEYDTMSWAPSLTAQRVMNWLRHLEILLDGATPDQAKSIQRALSTQVQSLKIRAKLALDPVDRLLAAAALVAASVSHTEEQADLPDRLIWLNSVLAGQIDQNGMHFSRNPRTQLQLLVELSSLRHSLGTYKSELSLEFIAQIERMHEALDALRLGTGEAAYFNGGGQLAHDTLIAVQTHGSSRRRPMASVAGYGILRDGDAVVIADSGLVPPPAFSRDAHSSALAFEFSHGTELIVGNCGPAPGDFPDSRDLFRQGIAHSSVTIDDESANPVPERGPFAGCLVVGDSQDDIDIKPADHLMVLRTDGYGGRYGLILERRITLLSQGTTLVGQDRVIAKGSGPVSGDVAVRFHLAPGIMVRRVGDGVVRLILSSGAVWTFLWEGAQLREDQSVRQSASRGFDKTRQLVLEREAVADAEIAWIFTREQA